MNTTAKPTCWMCETPHGLRIYSQRGCDMTRNGDLSPIGLAIATLCVFALVLMAVAG